MKKFFFIISTFGLMVSCGDKVEKTKTQTKDTITVNKVQSESEKPSVIISYSKDTNIGFMEFDKVRAITKEDPNTLYVTNIWATWCKPCVIEIPHFVKLQEKLKGKKIKFIFLNIEDKDVTSFVEEYKMKGVYQIPQEDLLQLSKKLQEIDPKIGNGIPITIFEKGETREAIVGSLDEKYLSNKIDEYLKVK